MNENGSSRGGQDKRQQRVAKYLMAFYRKANQLHGRLLAAYFFPGILLSLYTHTWLMALLQGGTTVTMVSIGLQRNATFMTTGRYFGAAAFGCFTWPFAYQLGNGVSVEMIKTNSAI